MLLVSIPGGCDTPGTPTPIPTVAPTLKTTTSPVPGASIEATGEAEVPDALTATPAPNAQLITDIMARSGKSYRRSILQLHREVYIDRNYIFEELERPPPPSFFRGQEYIRTSNDDKQRKDDDFLTFKLSRDAMVYVFYDARAVDTATLPAWLNDGTWNLTEDTIEITDPSGHLTLRVFRKAHSAGTVTLGGNLQPPAVGERNMYTVVATPLVDAGFDQTITLPSKAKLDGRAWDPTTSVFWNQVSGPQDVIFDDPSDPGTEVTFPEAGNYILRLNGSGTSDAVAIKVNNSPLSIANTKGGMAYDWGKLTKGSKVYIDRDYTYEYVPPAWYDLDYLRTANEYKDSTNDPNVNPLFSFDVDQGVRVCIAHDDRIVRKPDWLNSFDDMGDDLVTEDARLSLFCKEFAAGRIILGGNHAPGGSNFSMYTLVVQPKGELSAMVDEFGITKIYATLPGTSSWNSLHWHNNIPRELVKRDPDSYDPTGWSYEKSGTFKIDGDGLLLIQEGGSPRFYVGDAPEPFWKNVEITSYHMRVADADLSYGGFTLGARSGPNGHSPDGDHCTATTYYARLGNDGLSRFLKELVHPTVTAVSEKPIWGGASREHNTWVGMKFIVYNLSNGHVKLEMYMDETDGAAGGTWKLVNELVDDGTWSAGQDKELPECIARGLFTDGEFHIIREGNGVVLTRDDGVSDGRYKHFTIREITPP